MWTFGFLLFALSAAALGWLAVSRAEDPSVRTGGRAILVLTLLGFLWLDLPGMRTVALLAAVAGIVLAARTAIGRAGILPRVTMPRVRV